jgi:hypothetical protein
MSIYREYLSGSLASSFTAAVFAPLETVKVRLQVQDMPGTGIRRIYNNGFVQAMNGILRQDGVRLFWSHGLAAFVARDFWYSGVRTGMYPTVRNALSGHSEASLSTKITAGAVTGALGAGLANPFDVVRVRMTVEGGRVDAMSGRLTTGMRAGHAPRWNNSWHCASETARHEGAKALLLQGIGPSMARAGLLTAAQMSTYDHIKTVARRSGRLGEGAPLHLLAAALSGLVAAAACNPADVLKSRVMMARARAGAGAGAGADAAMATVRGVALDLWRREGVRGYFRGFGAHYARIGPTILLQMPVAEQLRKWMGVQAL